MNDDLKAYLSRLEDSLGRRIHEREHSDDGARGILLEILIVVVKALEAEKEAEIKTECDCWVVHQNLNLDSYTCGCPCHRDQG